MTDFAKWQNDNARYLANAIARLCVLLERRAGQEHERALVLLLRHLHKKSRNPYGGCSGEKRSPHQMSLV
jgi:hypothetical protein